MITVAASAARTRGGPRLTSIAPTLAGFRSGPRTQWTSCLITVRTDSPLSLVIPGLTEQRRTGSVSARVLARTSLFRLLVDVLVSKLVSSRPMMLALQELDRATTSLPGPARQARLSKAMPFGRLRRP